MEIVGELHLNEEFWVGVDDHISTTSSVKRDKKSVKQCQIHSFMV